MAAKNGSVHAATAPNSWSQWRGIAAAEAPFRCRPAAMQTAPPKLDHVQRYHIARQKVPAILQTGEAMLNRRASATLGRNTINQLNRNRARTSLQSGDRNDPWRQACRWSSKRCCQTAAS